MSVEQQVFFFISVMVLHFLVPRIVAFAVTFLPTYSSSGQSDTHIVWYLNVHALRNVSLFVSSFAFTGLIATMFADFILACVIGVLAGLYNLWSQRTIEKYFG